MDTPHQDELIVAKLEDTIAQISETITSLKGQRAQGEPDAASERAYYTRQLNAYKRALRYWSEGLRPRAFGNGYLVPSGSTPGKAPYYVQRHGNVWVCDPTCKYCGEIHWHTAIVGVLEQLLEQLPELAAAHDDGPDGRPCRAADDRGRQPAHPRRQQLGRATAHASRRSDLQRRWRRGREQQPVPDQLAQRRRSRQSVGQGPQDC